MGPVVVATDLTEHALPAIVAGRAHAAAVSAPLIVCHVVLDVFRHHPLLPDAEHNDLLIESNVMARAAELASEQVRSALGEGGGPPGPEDCRVVVESGEPDEEIVALAEREGASLVVVGAKPREGAEKVLGHVAERVVRYAPGSVLVARGSPPSAGSPPPAGRPSASGTGGILVATDFTEGSLPALRIAQTLSLSRSRAPDEVSVKGREVTLMHTVTPTTSLWSSALMPLGDTFTPPPRAAVEELEVLGLRTLEGLAKQYGFARCEQLEGSPADAILARAGSLRPDLIVMGSRGRRGIARLVLGSVAEKVIRGSSCSVLIAR